MKRGYYGIGIYQGKTKENLGTLWRSAQNFGASFIFTIGKRYKLQSSDTTKTFKHIPLYNYDTLNDFLNSRPYDCKLIGIEQSDRSHDLKTFVHPERAIYLLGAEDDGLPDSLQNICQEIIHINSPMCLNVAVAGSIIMYDRLNKS
jgi:tRNA G18 (ribose-2'-O)-methylase SpoU